MNDFFRRFAHKAAAFTGTAWVFLTALLVIIIWAVTGPLFRFSDTWQLIINTGTTIVTFLMVFLIQNTQNRDAVAMHLKLDELLRAVKGARTGMVDLEDLSDEQLAHLQHEFEDLRHQHGDDLAAPLKAVKSERHHRREPKPEAQEIPRPGHPPFPSP